jgi:gliding motility-associated-like protein
MKRKYIFAVLCWLMTLSVWGIEPPELQCINMNYNATNCQVYWNHPTHYAGISTIEVWVSPTLDGPYELGTTINALDTVCSTIFNINEIFGPTVDDIYCYLIAQPDAAHASEGSAISDTMHSMKLQLTPIGNNPTHNSIALLEWNAPSPFPSTCAGQNYSIMRKGSHDNDFITIGQVSQNVTSYRDTIDVCQEDYSYCIRLFNYAQDINPACPFKTKPKSGSFADATPPATPILDSVSVNAATQRIELGWTQTSPDAIGCVIYHATSASGPWPAIDTVPGTHWISPNHQGNTLHYYRIAAIDSCFESVQTIAGNMTASPQNNIVVSVASIDACLKKIVLTWNPYEHMTHDIGEYRVFYSQDNGPLQYLDAVGSNTTSYACMGLPTNHQYRFIVRAINTDGNISSSSYYCDVTNYIEEETTEFCYIRHASVIDNQYVEIQVLTEGNQHPFTNILLYRSVNNTQNFNQIANINYQNGQANYRYEDHTADVNGSINYYKAILYNECGAESASSNIAHTILLTGEGTAAQENVLHWNNYGEFNGGTASYSVYRKLEISPYFDGIGNNIPASEQNDYSDNVSDLFEMGSHFQYYVIAHEGLNEYGFADESVSNIIEVEQFPNTYIPSAFTPNGTIIENQVFKPANSFMNTVGYLFAIYSRQGEIVFITNDITQGWDGTEQKSGKAVPAGMYVYRMEYVRPDGKKVVKNGTVMLIY